MRPDLRLTLVLVCFLLSGFAALLYQTVWTREFAFVFGTSELAVATVLAAYMGGLAGGAAIAGRFAERVRRPVLTYGLLELGIAASALAVPVAVGLSTDLYVALFGGADTPPTAGGGLQAVYYLLSSFLILFVPTGLMGATLPMLARHAVREEREIGARIGLLYATNTAGAVCGTLCAAFFLLPAIGQHATVLVGASINALVFVVATLLARLPPGPVAEAAAPSAEVRRVAGSWILPVILLSGICSFTYEVLWTRLLGHVLGGSVYAFSTMLASFLVGITIGSAIAARLATTRERATRGFAIAQLGTAALSLVAFAGVDALPALAVALGAGWQGSLGANAALSASVLLPSTLCIGATFPFAVRILARSAADASAATARVYSWNTVGAIAGAVGAGFFVVPLLGYRGSVLAAALANLVLAGIASWFAAPRAKVLLATSAVGAAIALVVPPATPWRLLRSSPFDLQPAEGEVTYFAVGRGATVLLLQRAGDPGTWHLRTNGLPEASIGATGDRAGRYPVNGWLSALPVLARPDAKQLVVVGLGGGLAVEDVPRSVEEIDVIELEPEVVAANRAVSGERRRDPLADPRVRLHVNDARGSLVLTDARFDAITSQPSHPWTAGASHLYTKEFFELARDRLAEDGVFVQWIGLAFVDEFLLRSLVATLLEVFPFVEVYRPEANAVLFLASKAPLDLASSADRAIAKDPATYAQIGVSGASDVLRARVLDAPGSRAFAKGALVNTDDHNFFETRSTSTLRTDALRAAGASRVLGPFDPLVREAPPGARLRDVRRLLAAGLGERAQAVAAAIPDSAERQTALGLAERAAGRDERAAALLSDALRLDPNQTEARFALVQIRRRALEQGNERALELAAGLSSEQSAVVEGWKLESAGRFDDLERIEERLAAVPAGDPAVSDALRLRAAWRLDRGDAANAREAMALLDRASALDGSVPGLVLRIRAAAQAGHSRAALGLASELAASIERAPRTRTKGSARLILETLDRLDLPPELTDEARVIRARLAPFAGDGPDPDRGSDAVPAQREG
ncbi:Polyamine aminopropyltransferase [Myxococcaceae bacterium]|nr:Polyamine aminopropyltransferase [Myxococcaceae bacterium]